MRFVKPSANWMNAKGAILLLVAFAFGPVSGLLTFAQAKPAPPAASKPQAKPAPPAKAPAKAMPAPKAAAKREAAASTPPARRDPFQPLISKEAANRVIPENLPPGIGGLVISTLRIDGIVRAPSGMIAVVSNPQNRVYFVREGANLYDGLVERITLESIVFR